MGPENTGSVPVGATKKQDLNRGLVFCSAYGNRTRMPRLRILYPNR